MLCDLVGQHPSVLSVPQACQTLSMHSQDVVTSFIYPYKVFDKPCNMILDLASASTHCLLPERGCSDLARPAILASRQVTDEFHVSQGTYDISPVVLSYPSYTPRKPLTTMLYDNGPCFNLNTLFVVGDRVLRSGCFCWACTSGQ